MSKFQQLAELGQALWLDYIRRSFVTSGELAALVEQGLRGVTSNPSIFEKAIAGSTDYDQDIRRQVDEGRTAGEIYESLILEDIRMAADVLRPVFDATDGLDGYVSVEVSPALANDSEGTIGEAHRLFSAVDRPNVMIKIPATAEGIPAIRRLVGEGMNINVTLMFSLSQYDAVAEAYLAGLEDLAAAGGDLSTVASVASFFVSRVDTRIDRRLDELAGREPTPADLRGQIGIANARLAYRQFQSTFSGGRWAALEDQGARPQRVLWASTSVKDPSYPDTLYVDELIGPNVVNTVPPDTLQAYLDHGKVAPSVTSGLDEAEAALAHLNNLGVDLEAVTDQLLEDGLEGFSTSFQKLIRAIEEKRDRLLSGWDQHQADLGAYGRAVDDAVGRLRDGEVLRRLWSHDYTLWSDSPKEIANRLGWLHIAPKIAEELAELDDFRQTSVGEGFEQAVLLGMGGSSLAPQVFHDSFGVAQGGLRLDVLDSTHPDAVLGLEHRIDLTRTLFLVATKSGGTVETLSFFKYLYNQVAAQVGMAEAGRHFAAITDPGTSLVDLASRYRFRAVFQNDPNIGGRYSALSYFGLVPAALLGLDLELLLDRAMAMACGCESCVPEQDNPAAWLGAAMAALAQTGRDKLTLITSPEIASFGDWVEQLIAESTGKGGKGILPVVGEDLGPPTAYAQDRVFVHLRLGGDEGLDAALQAIQQAGHPLIRFNLRDAYDLGGQMFLWEFATAIAGHLLGIHPFDQPNVEAAKVLARDMVAAYQDTGQLPSLEPSLSDNGLQVYGDIRAVDPGQALRHFLAQADPGGSPDAPRSYISLQAYLDPTPELVNLLKLLQCRLRDQYRLATTLGFGPRFLHSTGQLHKGDAGNGLFIQLTDDPGQKAEIPDVAGETKSGISFGVLVAAQALGDRQALLDAGRRVIRFDLGSEPGQNLMRLLDALS